MRAAIGSSGGLSTQACWAPLTQGVHLEAVVRGVDLPKRG